MATAAEARTGLDDEVGPRFDENLLIDPVDAETEHALFERYASAARDDRAEGCITVLVSH